MSGLVFKNGNSLSDKQILTLLKRDTYIYRDKVELEKAISIAFEGIAITRLENIILVFGKDIPHACSFNEENLSLLDVQLEALSKKGDILCFHSHSPSDTYAWSIFKKGKRVSARCASAGKQLSSFGSDTVYDKDIQLNDQGIIELVERFTGKSYVSWITNETRLAAVYSYN